MDLLVVGGTRFSGWFTVQRALARGHRVTLIHRGQSLDEAGFPQAEHLVGDRTDPAVLSALTGRSFDAVIDFCGQLPAQVRALIEAVGELRHYTFVSSSSVYGDASRPGLDETCPTAEPAGDDVVEITGETYGPLKAACEQVVLDALADRAHIVRPGLIIGPRDPTGRFSWWPARLAAGGRTVAPLPADQPVQGIDARDLATFLLAGAELHQSGIVNAAGEPTPLSRLIEACQRQADDPAEVVWMDPDWLEAHDVEPWTNLPLWLGTDPEFGGLNQLDTRRARAAGLHTRAMAASARDVLRWVGESDRGVWSLGSGLRQTQETELLEAWARRQERR